MHPRADLLAKVSHKVKVKLTRRSGHYFTGTFWAFDGHLNVVLSSACEWKELRVKEVQTLHTGTDQEEEVVSWSARTEKREVGVIVLRGSWVESIEELEVPRQRRDNDNDSGSREMDRGRPESRSSGSSAPRPQRRESGGGSRDRDDEGSPQMRSSRGGGGKGGDCKQQ